MQQGFVVLSKSVNERHIAENLNVLDFELKSADMNALESIAIEVPDGPAQGVHFAWDTTDIE